MDPARRPEVIRIAFVRRILHTGVLATMPADDLARALEPIVHTTLYGRPPSPPGSGPGSPG
jgi:hypothetical protein